MPFEIHRGMENPDDLENVISNAKKDYMSALSRQLTVRKQVVPKTIGGRMHQDFLKTLPEPVTVNLALPLIRDSVAIRKKGPSQRMPKERKKLTRKSKN